MTRQKRLPSHFFLGRRKALADLMKEGEVAILDSNPTFYSNGDTAFPFKQNSNLYYLSGILQSNTRLIIQKETKSKFKSYLFIEKDSAYAKQWLGSRHSLEEAKKISGIERVCTLEDFDAIVGSISDRSETFLFSLDEHPRGQSKSSTHWKLFKQIKSTYPLHRYGSLDKLALQLRLFKQPIEIDAIKKAITITKYALEQAKIKVNEATKKNMATKVYEYELEAEMSRAILSKGANGFAFLPIIAAGGNACILHYTENKDYIKPGESVLIDVGAQYGMYNADITRVYPSGGKFNPRQREVYKKVLEIRQVAINCLKKRDKKRGLDLQKYRESIKQATMDAIIGLGLVKKSDGTDKITKAATKYLPHGVSHMLGLEVHDVSPLSVENFKLKTGMVITVEPGIYIEEEGIGMRLEDDILLTKSGIENLSEKIPIRLEEIETI